MRPCRAESRSRPIAVRLSHEEFSVAAQAAKVNRQPVSTFVREAILSAAGDCLELDDQKSARDSA